jgi:hypothetical protein
MGLVVISCGVGFCFPDDSAVEPYKANLVAFFNQGKHRKPQD